MNELEQFPEGGPPESTFAPRAGRALVVVGLSLAVHMWGLPAVRRQPALPGTPPALHLLKEARAAAPAPTPRARAAGDTFPSVQIRRQFIEPRQTGTPSQAPYRAASAVERPVGTAGRTDGPVLHRPGSEAAEPAAAIRPAAAALSVAEAEIPAAEPPLPPAMAAVPAAALVSDAPGRRDEEIVRQLLRDYAAAFERLDVQAAKAIWPTVDERGLQRAFQRLDGQELHFESCGVAVSGRDANARCRGNATYRPKVGSRVLRLTAREWTFNLSRDNDRWQIVNATLQ